MWRNGLYTMSAVSVAISRFFNGRKAKGKYPEKPLLQSEKLQGKYEKTLSEDEIKQQRKNLLAILQLKKINFEMNHKKEARE